MKITYSLASAEPGGALHTLDWNLDQNPNLTKTNDGTDKFIENGISLTWQQVLDILADGGVNAEVEEYLLVIKAPKAGLNVDVPAGLPDRDKLTPTGTDVRKINEWLIPNNIWYDGPTIADSTYIYFLTTTMTGQYLKGSEIKLLDDMANVSILLTTDPEFTALQ